VDLDDLARRLGVAAPAAPLLDAVREAIGGKLAVAEDNALAPGFAPWEISFTDGDPDALRMDVELRAGSARERLERTVALVAPGHPELAARLDQRLELVPDEGHFGAWLGLSLGPEGERWRKVYLEVRRAPGGSFAPVLGLVEQRLPAFQPHFHSVAGGRDGVVERLYLLNRVPVPLLDLTALLDAWGVSTTPFLQAVARLGPGWTLGAGRASLGLRPLAGGVEVKLDLLYDEPHPAPWWPGAPSAAWMRWCQAVRPGPPAQIGAVGAAGVKATPGKALAHTVYVRPAPVPRVLDPS